MSKIKLNAASGGSVALKPPTQTTSSADVELTLPVNDGDNGQFIQTNGSGALSFATPAATNTNSLQVLEQFYVPCDGTSVVTNKGTVSIENTFTTQTLETTFADVTGSSITYQPPDNTKIVIYRFTKARYKHSDYKICYAHNYLQEVAVSDHPFTERADDNLAVVTWDHAFRIEPTLTADAGTGRVQSWNAARTIKIKARDHTTSYHARLHYLNNASAPNSSTNTSLNCRPKIAITAIGSVS